MNAQHSTAKKKEINKWLRSNSFRSVALVLLLMLCALSAGMAVGAITEDDVYRVLTENSVKYDTQLVHDGMIAGMLRSVDSRACLLSTNDIIRIKNLVTIASTEKLSANIGYLKLNGLYKGSGDKICRELESNTNEYISGHILDLRGAGGNDLQSVNNVINHFSASNTLLYNITDNSGGIIEGYSTPSSNVTENHSPFMVLVNENTHDASEVLAALLKGKEHVLLIGSATKGHRGLMEVIPYSELESLYIVTKHVVLADTTFSFTNGVAPDIFVTEDSTNSSDLAVSGKILIGKNISPKAQTDRKLMERVANDAVLRRATDVLLALKAVNNYGCK